MTRIPGRPAAGFIPFFVPILFFLITIGPAQAQLDFAPCQILPSGGQWPRNLVAADFNSDAITDLVVRNVRTDTLAILFGTGGGSFAEPQIVGTFATPDNPAMATGDYNHDGFVDLIVGSSRGSVVLLGDGLGGFGDPLSVLPPAADGMCPADFDGDGVVDVAIQSSYGPIQLYQGDGTGTFQFIGSFNMVSSRLEAGDFNGDSIPDIAGYLRSSVAVALGDGTGLFTPMWKIRFCPYEQPRELASGDFDGDGREELLASLQSGNVALFTNFGANGFTSLQFLDGGDDTGPLVVADFNGDSLLDIAAGNRSQRTVAILLGDGQGGFAPVIPVATCLFQATAMVAADLDGDCRLDLALGAHLGNLVHFVLNRTLEVHLAGTVNAAFGPPENVLLLNNSAGAGNNRRVQYSPRLPFELRMLRPSSMPPNETAPFVVYAWANLPRPDEGRTIPFQIGCIANPIPLTGGSPQPDAIWNNAQRVRLLGMPTHPSTPAPSVLFRKPGGLSRGVPFFVQGIVFDPGSQGLVQASVTNGIIGVPVSR